MTSALPKCREDVLNEVRKRTPKVDVLRCSDEIPAHLIHLDHSTHCSLQWQHHYIQVNQAESITARVREHSDIPEPYNNTVHFICMNGNLVNTLGFFE